MPTRPALEYLVSRRASWASQPSPTRGLLYSGDRSENTRAEVRRLSARSETCLRVLLP